MLTPVIKYDTGQAGATPEDKDSFLQLSDSNFKTAVETILSTLKTNNVKVFTVVQMSNFYNNSSQMLYLTSQNWVNKENLSHAHHIMTMTPCANLKG